MFVMSFIFVIVCGLFELKMCKLFLYCFFVSILSLYSDLSSGGWLGSHQVEDGWDLIKWRMAGISSSGGWLGSHQVEDGWDLIKWRMVGISSSCLTLPHIGACPNPTPGFH
jgi:hypothetical protein